MLRDGTFPASAHQRQSVDEVMSRGLPIVECLHKDKAFPMSECEHPARFVGSISNWLLDEDMLSSCKRFHSPLVMEAIWQLVSSINVLSATG